MPRATDPYRDYVEHPRYGRRPRITGLHPRPGDPGVFLGRAAWSDERHARPVPNTAIVADRLRQTPATIPVTHYFDLDRRCCDCRRRFLFFAEEQRHWYEELRFSLDADCVRCVECRRRQREVARLRRTYETLVVAEARTEKETLELADVCLRLIEAGVCSMRKREFARRLLNSVPDDSDARGCRTFAELTARARRPDA